MRCEAVLGGWGHRCVQIHPTCVEAGNACGGPGRRTLSCCDRARCVRNPGNGDMRCEAIVGESLAVVENSSTVGASTSTTASSSPSSDLTLAAMERCSAQGEACSFFGIWAPTCCDGMQCARHGFLNWKCDAPNPQCAQQGEPCGGAGRDTAQCCSGMQCEALLGGIGHECVRTHPECVDVGQACGGPGRQTLSCCGAAQCIRNPGNGNMRCEATVR